MDAKDPRPYLVKNTQGEVVDRCRSRKMAEESRDRLIRTTGKYHTVRKERTKK